MPPRKTIECPNEWCDRLFANLGHLAKHRVKCDRNGAPPPCRRFTLSPNEALWPNSTTSCALCPGAPLIAHRDGKSYASCAHWDDPRHRDRDAARQARNDRDVARRAAGAGGHVVVRPRGDQAIDWRARLESLGGGSREEELVAWTEENPGWRADDDRKGLFEPLARRLEITSAYGYLGGLSAKLSEIDAADVPKLTGGTNYRDVCRSVKTLARCPGGDPMFGGIPPLTTLLLCGTVESRLLVLVTNELRRAKASMRKAASGAESRRVVSERSRMRMDRPRSMDVRGLSVLGVNLRESGVIMGSALAQRRRWRDHGGMGLRVNVDGMRLLVQRLPRQTRVADPRAVGDLDCDFGSQANNEIPYQAPNVKLDGEGAMGDATTRLYTRPENFAIARMLPALGLGDRVTFQVCCRGEAVIEYKIDPTTWRDDVGQAALHFLQTYDTAVYDKHVAADPWRWARDWTRGLTLEDGCGGVVYGRSCSFVVNGETYGRCPYTDRLFLLIADSLDRTKCLVALDKDYDWDRDQPLDDTSVLPRWPGDRSMREELLRAAVPRAWDALRIAEVEILPRVETAFASEHGDVVAAVRAGYAAVRRGAETMGAGPFLDNVRRRYAATVAPKVLDELGRARRFEITTYNLRDLDAGPVGKRYRFVPRTGLDDLLGAPDTSRLPAVPASPGRGDVDELARDLLESPGNFSAEDDDDGAALPEVPKSRTRRRRRARRRRPPDGSTQPDSTARSLGAGGLPPVL